MERPAVDTGYHVARGVIPLDRVEDVLRTLHLDVLEKGVSAATLSEWLWGTHWFPHLRYTDEVMALAEALPPEWQTGSLCDPQIILQFPHTGPEPEITFHLDQEPDWAEGRRYVRIVGIALSEWRRENGGPLLPGGDAGVGPGVHPRGRGRMA